MPVTLKPFIKSGLRSGNVLGGNGCFKMIAGHPLGIKFFKEIITELSFLLGHVCGTKCIEQFHVLLAELVGIFLTGTEFRGIVSPRCFKHHQHIDADLQHIACSAVQLAYGHKTVIEKCVKAVV